MPLYKNCIFYKLSLYKTLIHQPQIPYRYDISGAELSSVGICTIIVQKF